MVGMSIADNLERVHESVRRAAARAGREATSIKLIAVSKTQPIERIDEALRAGQLCFGENYVQEAVDKVRQRPQAEWHLIGSLQTNKVKQIAGKFALIHSVDRAKLAIEIDKTSAALDCVQDVLLQVHVGDEASKHGVAISQAPELLSQIQQCSNLRLRGVMALPPLSEEEAVARRYFSEVRRAFENWKNDEVSPAARPFFTELSLGTSSDYEWAILEGATMVRVGTAIFGARAT